ncbi:unnamed protein product, partial [Phaeothamnion confervicola]
MVSPRDLTWALECVLSRAFAGGFGGGRLALAAAATAVCGAGAAAYALDSPLPLALAALAIVASNFAELNGSGSGCSGGKDKAGWVLVPMIDSMNHRTEAKSELAFSPLSESFTITVNKPIATGEQALISYGRRTNDELLQFFGFVEADNPADCYTLADLPARLPPPAAARAAALRACPPLAAAADRLSFARGGTLVAGAPAAAAAAAVASAPAAGSAAAAGPAAAAGVAAAAAAALRMLLCGDDELAERMAEAGGPAAAFARPVRDERRVWEALAAVLREDAVALKSAGGSGMDPFRATLARQFRAEKLRVLDEALAAVEARVAAAAA